MDGLVDGVDVGVDVVGLVGGVDVGVDVVGLVDGLDVGVDVVGPVDGLDVGPDVVGLAVGRAVDIRAALVVDASGRKQRRGGKKNSNTNESGNVCGCKSEHASVSGSLVRVEVSRAICRANTTPSVSMAALGSS